MKTFKIFLNSVVFGFYTLIYFNWLELGVGWAAAVADDSSELEFFKQNNRISSDDRNYWIGGLAYDTLAESKIFT